MTDQEPDLILKGAATEARGWVFSARAQRLMSLFAEKGIDLYAVGGCVRDCLLKRPAKDMDFATSAAPAIIAHLFPGQIIAGLGQNYGTSRLIFEGAVYEITTFRKDIDSDGRHPQVAFSSLMEEDGARRDFTINALYLDRAGHLYDPTGLGLEDCHQRYLRFIGQARHRLNEDHLRGLRFFRFLSEIPKLIPETVSLEAALADRVSLDQLSAERLWQESSRLLMGDHAASVISLLEDKTYLDSLIGLPAGSLMFLRLLSLPQPIAANARLLRLASLPRELSDQTLDHLTKRFRLSNREHKALSLLIRESLPSKVPEMIDLRRWRFLYGLEGAESLLFRVALLNENLPLALWSGAHGALLASGDDRFPFRAQTLMDRGVRPGPGLGRLLKALKRLWLEAGMPYEKDALDQLIGLCLSQDPQSQENW